MVNRQRSYSVPSVSGACRSTSPPPPGASTRPTCDASQWMGAAARCSDRSAAAPGDVGEARRDYRCEPLAGRVGARRRLVPPGTPPPGASTRPTRPTPYRRHWVHPGTIVPTASGATEAAPTLSSGARRCLVVGSTNPLFFTLKRGMPVTVSSGRIGGDSQPSSTWRADATSGRESGIARHDIHRRIRHDRALTFWCRRNVIHHADGVCLT